MMLRLAPILAVALLPCAACSRQGPSTSPAGDAAAPGEIAVRVPAGLRLARALDTLSVSVDPAALATTRVVVDPGMVLGVETESFVAPIGQPRPSRGRRALAAGQDLDAAMPAWSTEKDGIPVPGTRYDVEVRVVLFETDVPPGRAWDPHAGRFKALWTRTLRQAEE